jgi:hypothetical protein
MNPLDLSVKLARAKLITGESMPVELSLENRGDVALEVPDPGVGSPFLYAVESTLDDEATYQLSAAIAYAERHLEPKPPRRLPGLALAPGASMVYREDVARYLTRPLGPGSYTLMASYQGPSGVTQSVPVEFTIEAPRPARVVTCSDTNRARLSAVFAQPSSGDSLTVYQLEQPAGRPGDGPAYARKHAIPSSALGGLAVTVAVAEGNGGRWIGWLEGDAICAALGDEHYVSRLVSPVAHGLQKAQLAPVGFQIGDQALFLALGEEGEGRVVLVAATFGPSAPPTLKRIPIAGAAIPDRWATRYRDIGVDRVIDLIVATPADGMTSIVRQTISLGSETAGWPETLHTDQGRLVAMAMDPVGRGDASDGAVDLLLTREPANGSLSLVRVGVSAGAVGSSWNFAGPDNRIPAQSARWALPRVQAEPPTLVAHAGEAIYLRRRRGRWHRLVEGVPEVWHLGVEVLADGRQVLVWGDPLIGLRWRLLY